MLHLIFFLLAFLHTVTLSAHDNSYSKAIVQDIGTIFQNINPGDCRDYTSYSGRYTILHRKKSNEFVITRVFLASLWQDGTRLVEKLDMYSTISRVDSKVIIKTVVTGDQIYNFLIDKYEPLSADVRKIIKKFFMKSAY